MRAKKAGKNAVINLFMVLIGFIPALFVRQIFLEALGSDLLGLSSLYSSIIGLLSLAELGITSAIIFALYKPFAENDRPKIKAYIKYYSKFYKAVGIIIFIAGLALMPFLHLFVKGDIEMLDAQLYLILSLISTVATYFFSAKFCILVVAQEGYKIVIGITFSKLFTALLQILLLSYYSSFYWFLTIQLIISLIYLVTINFYVFKKFGWIYNNDETIQLDDKKSLMKNIKALFIHKIGEVAVFSSDNLIISYSLNLATVGVYNSYFMIIAAFTNVVSSTLSGITATIGNLLVNGDSKKAYSIHKKLFFISFWIVSFLTISLSNTLKQFVFLWLGETQLLNNFTISLLLLNFYFVLMRISVDKFKEAGGIYHQDRFSAIIEAIINLLFSIILVKYMGLAGVILGTVISNLTIVFWIKPKMVYKYIFKEKLSKYFIMYFTYTGIGLFPLFMTHLVTMYLKEIPSYSAFVLNCFINLIIINLYYLIVFRNTEEFIYFKDLFLNKFFKTKEEFL